VELVPLIYSDLKLDRLAKPKLLIWWFDFTGQWLGLRFACGLA
jgi:hypothetical protein